MSIEGKAKEAAGFVKEETFEHGKSDVSKEKAQEGRDLRNEGRVEDGKRPRRPSRAPVTPKSEGMVAACSVGGSQSGAGRGSLLY